ncbi:MAG: DUF4276 family protein [Bacillota bacterium]|nr:DUF4276 family protein [Bacillota bacterium]
MYLNVVVEGQTEETFVRDVLAPYWGAKGIFAVARCVETGRKHGRVYKGGGRNYEKIRRDVLNWISQRPDAYCTTMFDLYGLPHNFPGKTSNVLNYDPYVKVSHLESFFADDINNHRFVPYIQLHEFEALLFAGIEKINDFYFGKNRVIERLKTIADSFDSPELINDGHETAPSKRIISAIPEYKDNKVLIGPATANAIGLLMLREKCSHFDEWLKKIEHLN